MSPLTASAALPDAALLGVLRLLEASPSRTQRELAQELGISLGKTNYVLRALLRKGLVKARNFRDSPTKRGYAYLLTPKGLAAKAELTQRFLARKIQEYDALRLEIERLRMESSARPASRWRGMRE
jgi:MarR family transcriptional regulator, temperature-dependent positive regulator of motility